MLFTPQELSRKLGLSSTEAALRVLDLHPVGMTRAQVEEEEEMGVDYRKVRE